MTKPATLTITFRLGAACAVRPETVTLNAVSSPAAAPAPASARPIATKPSGPYFRTKFAL